MKVVVFEGKRHSFPDDATDDEIAEVLGGSSPAPAQSTAEAAPAAPIGVHPDGPEEPLFTRENLASVGKDLAIGGGKRIGQYLHGAGKLVRDYSTLFPPDEAADAEEDAIADANLAPSNETQAAAALPADIAAGVAATAATGGIGGAGVLGAMTRGGLAAAGQDAVLRGKVDSGTGVSALIGAGGGVAEKLLGRLSNTEKGRELAEWLYTKALAPKAASREVAERVVPQAVERGLKDGPLGGRFAGSIDEMAGPARSGKLVTGKALENAVAGHAGETIKTASVLKDIDEAISGMTVRGRGAVAGGTRTVPITTGNPNALKNLREVRAEIAALGEDIPADAALQLKRQYQEIVDQAGGFDRGVSSLADASMADAKETGRAALGRELHDAFPDIKEASTDNAFWQGWERLVTEAEQSDKYRKLGLGLHGNFSGLLRATIARPGFLTGAGQLRLRLAEALTKGRFPEALEIMRAGTTGAAVGAESINRKKFEEDAQRRKLEASMGLH